MDSAEMGGMKYIRVKWSHAHPHEPVWLYTELNDSRSEVRKVHVFPDGHAEWADNDHEIGSTRLSETPIPSVDQINTQAEFQAIEIPKDEFGRVWTGARTSN